MKDRSRAEEDTGNRADRRGKKKASLTGDML